MVAEGLPLPDDDVGVVVAWRPKEAKGDGIDPDDEQGPGVVRRIRDGIDALLHES